MYAINEEKMFYDMADGQAIVIDFQTGMYYGMSSLGSAVIDALVHGSELSGLEKGLFELPDCPSNISEQLRTFADTLVKMQILVERDQAGSDSPIVFSKEAFMDGFRLDVNEFAEAQDLILADPIHDVDVDMGWPIMKGSD